MKRKLVAGLVATFLLIVSLTAAQELNRPQTASEQPSVVVSQPVVSPPTVDELLRLVNEERAKVGVKPLRLDPLLNKSAQWKSDDMVNRNYFGHWPETMDGKPNTEKYTMNLELRIAVGRMCVSSSENISWGDKVNTSESAMVGWINSEPHYKAMVDPRYESTGIGISGNKIAQHFCDEK